MSIKKLFDNAVDNSRLSAGSEKEIFEEAESSKNIQQKIIDKKRFVPTVDYSDPANFATYGSARLYYNSALKRITDFYPYDGSEFELTKFLNESLDIEKYVLKNLYPSSTGYINLARGGYSVSEVIDDYGIPTTQQYIQFNGGPGTGSAKSLALKDLLPNEANSSYKSSNIYDTNLYRNETLPADYGTGTRESNLKANFDNGVTVEFWMKTGSIHNQNTSGRQVVFDAWNNKANTHADYSRLTIELTGTTNRSGGRKDPFIVTVQSGADQPRTIGRMLGLGDKSLHANMGDWNHYALRFYNTGSQKQILKSELYVNGRFSDSGSLSPYALTHSMELVQSSSHDWYVANDTNRYTSYKRLQGWWKLEDPRGEYVIDWSQNGRTGSYGSSSYKPAASSKTPSAYIQSASADFDSALYGVNIGDASLWNGIIGTNQTASNSPKFTISARIRKTGDGGGGYGRIIDFGLKDISLYSNNSNRIKFAVKWKSADGSSGHVVYRTPSASFTNDTWEHVLVTYDAAHAPQSASSDGSVSTDTLPGSLPRIYVNGNEKTVELESGAPTGSFFGIVNQNCVIGNVSQRNRNWEGEIADVAIWDIVLDQTDIKALGHAQDYRQPFTRIPELNDKSMQARIGALITNPISSSATAGAGRLSGSIDEFRYWKTSRNAREIGTNWFTNVRGGSNSDIFSADLGVYYKFNEGITTDTSVDSVVLDYAGRATNGVFVGYSTNCRNTGSAIVSASAANKEFEDPIIRTEHPRYIRLRDELHQTGSSYDYSNNAALIAHVPGWIQDEEPESTNSHLRYITHVIGAYLDKLKLQIAEVPKIKFAQYPSASHKVYPMAEHYPQSLGLYVPELFVDSTILEKFMNRSDTQNFENDIEETKNLIYQNLYRNLADIYKTKGTEKAIRNVLRCFNVSDGLLNLKINSNNQEYELRNNLTLKTLTKNFANFNTANNSKAVIYNRSASFPNLSIESVSGSVNGSQNQDPYGFTYEGNFLFPNYSNEVGNFIRDRDYDQISLFGYLQVASGDDDRVKGTDTTKNEDDQATMRVYAVRDKVGSKNAYFKLSSSFMTASQNFVLTSSTYFDLYDNEKWNLSVRVRPKKYPLAPFVTGSGDGTYEVVFAGYTAQAPGVYNSFRLSHDLTGTFAKHIIQSRKRPFVGADRVNLTGAVRYRSDVYASSVAFWMKYIGDDDLIQHAFDFENIGVSSSYKSISVLDTSLYGFNATNADTLVFNWNFGNVTGSDANGNFVVQDFSSGSVTGSTGTARDWVKAVSGYQYTGYGYGFNANSTDVVEKKTINTYKFVDPETVVSADMVQLFSDEDMLFPNLRRNEIVPSFQYSIEKSLYNAISEEMLDFFAGAADFHNIIGRPVNRYRGRYKTLEKLRETFFRRVKEIATVEKYIEYYKWYDEAITTAIAQLVPASSEFVNNISNIIESHVLERNKYKSKLNIIDSDQFWRAYEPVIPHVGGGGDDGVTDTSLESYPGSPRPTVKAPGYWDKRAESKQSEITSNNTTIDTQRDKFKSVIYTKPTYSSSAGLPNLTTVGGIRYMSNKYGDRTRSAGVRTMEIEIDQVKKDKTIIRTQRRVYRIKGGRNFKNHNSIDYTLSAVKPNGPVSKEDGVFVPQNVLLGFVSESIPLKDYIDFSWPDNFIRKKTKMFKVQHGRDWEDGIGYKNTKSTFSFPFNIMSASVQVDSGYNREVVQRVGPNLEITNLHIDGYGHLQEVPMQGIFTQDVVGGHQSRHVPLNDGTDAPENRPEAWRILLGTCNEDSEIGIVPTGAIGLVGPDYPPPDYNPPAGTLPYPYTPHEKAYLFRDHVAKRPVNIRNISQKSGSRGKTTVPGNYQNQYEFLHSFGATQNARQFTDQQPTLPLQLDNVKHTTNIRTFLDRHRGAHGHQQFVGEYNVGYLTGTVNKTIITNRFAGTLGPEANTHGARDFKAGEYSVYSAMPFRNLSVIKPSQNPTGSIPEPAGAVPTTTVVSDIHGRDFGLQSHYGRHTAKFGRDSVVFPSEVARQKYTLNKSFVGYSQYDIYRSSNFLQGWWRLNEDVSSTGTVADSSGNGRSGTFDSSGDRPAFSTTSFPSKFVQTASCVFANSDSDATKIGSPSTWDAIIGSTGSRKWTLAAWIFKTGDGGYVVGRIIDFGDTDISMYTDADDNLRFSARWSTGIAYYESAGTLNLNEWTHVALTYDASDRTNLPRMYINGVETVASSTSGAPGAGATFSGISTEQCYIGNRASEDAGFDGNLADVAVWSSILTPEEIGAIYNASKSPDQYGPGASYDQLPGFHKIHRNSRYTFNIRYDFKDENIPDTGLINEQSIDIDTGARGVIAIVEDSTKRRERVFDAVHADSNNDSVLFTWSGWLKPDSGGLKIFELGWAGSSVKPIHDLRQESGDKLRYYFQTTDGHGTFVNAYYETVDTVMTGSGWKNVVITVSGAHGSMPTGGSVGNTFSGIVGGPTVKIYVNGESKNLYFPGSSCKAYFPTSSENVSNFRGYGSNLTYPLAFFGRVDSISGYEYTGKADEIAMYSTTLTDAEVLALYNGGAPQNLTQSGIEGSSSLLSWWRMGDHPSDDMDGEDQNPTSPFSASNGNIIIDVKNAANLHFTAQRATQADPSLLKAGTSSANLTGQPPATRLVEFVNGYGSRKRYDNGFVTRPIPQNDRQYRWFSSSVIDANNIKYAGYQRTNSEYSPYRSSSAGRQIDYYWTFVTASDAITGSLAGGALFQPTNTRVNTITLDDVQEEMGLLGSELLSNVFAVKNEALVGCERAELNPDYLNQLLHKRGSKHGWGWNKFHQNDHPVLTKLRKSNKLLVSDPTFTSLPMLYGGGQTHYNVPVISTRGRPMLVNIGTIVADPEATRGMSRTSTTFKVTNTNEDIYFSDPRLNDLTNIKIEQTYKSYRDLIRKTRGSANFTLNWVLYSQNIFPSLRNEFVSGTQRTYFQNAFWANEQGNTSHTTESLTIGRRKLFTSPEERDQPYRATLGRYLKPYNSQFVHCSQSAWVLDPSCHFLTRSKPDNQGSPSGQHVYYAYSYNNVYNGFSGELQNEYNGYFDASTANAPDYYATLIYAPPSALYARPHILDTPTSVVSPQGPLIPETGSLPRGSASFLPANRLNIAGSGQALWEAGDQAGYLMKTSSVTTEVGSKSGVVFVSASSQPWWDSYDAFHEDLKLKAKGFAIIPEYRMSRFARHIMQNGIKQSSVYDIDHYELVGQASDFSLRGRFLTSNHPDMPCTASGNRHENFYKDFSNSDFLRNFLKIKKETLLKADEIRLSATGAIRFNPYDGFYPAQRTTQLVSEFSKSFAESFVASSSVRIYTGHKSVTYGKDGRVQMFQYNGKLVQNTLYQPMFAPGILFNSIKSGLAVDYPVIHDPSKVKSGYFGSDTDYLDNYALTITGSHGTGSTSGTSKFRIFSGSDGYTGGEFWDRRLPFEAIIRPKSFLPGYKFMQLETHPSASTQAAFWSSRYGPVQRGDSHFEKQHSHVQMSDQGDDVYSMAARNFFGECANFFLKDSELTTLESKTVTNDLQFSPGETYMARIKLRRSHNGARTYEHEVDTFGNALTDTLAERQARTGYGKGGDTGGDTVGIAMLNNCYGLNGARAYLSSSFSALAAGNVGKPLLMHSEFPIPQDPKRNPDFKETFTMYSRPSAFGPPVAGRPTGSFSTKNIIASGSENEPQHGFYTASFEKTAMDSFSGYNPAFTPPYTNGEAWVDLIFRPSASVAYDLERILAETQTYCWRFDTGPVAELSGSEEFGNNLPKIRGVRGQPTLLPVQQLMGTNCGKFNPELAPSDDNTVPSPYDGFRINVNSMQITSSLDIFGIERVLEQIQGPDGNSAGEVTNKTVGQKWLIRPKWETPMLNFNDDGPHGISANSGTLTLPQNFGAASVPRGMWHQFGTMPTSPDVGVFMEIGEIPLDWLRSHYLVNHEPSIYNNFDVPPRPRKFARKIKSLSKLCGFDRTNSEERLGEIKESMTISEAIVAVPYITNRSIESKAISRLKARNSKNAVEQNLKQFIRIPEPRWEKAINDEGDLLEAGQSIRRLADAMDKYIFPPEFDALNNPDVAPVAMYVLEFEYKFDQNDLSYIWQNIAPRDYKKLSFQKSTCSHNLANNELINASILNNEDLRWMVFKIKQRADTDYYELLVDQAGQATKQIDQKGRRRRRRGRRISPRERARLRQRAKFKAALNRGVQFNWPYDYLSFVELIKIDVDVLMKPPSRNRRSSKPPTRAPSRPKRSDK